MAASPIQPRATYDDLLRVPEHRVAELVDGDLYATPRPAPRHAAVTSSLEAELKWPFDFGRGGPGGWWLLFEPELHLGEDVLVPDLAGWRRERLPVLPDLPFFTLAPDWVCEVISPGTERLDRTRKLPAYAHSGVGHAWLVNPLARTLEILRLEQGRWTVVAAHAGDEIIRAEPFEAAQIDPLLLWGERRG
jgi:Uma2 family endonuclease